MTTTLVIGANGTVGSALVPLLERAGHTVRRASSRSALEPGQVHLNLVTGTGMAQAFDGVDRAFLLSPPGFTHQDQLLKPLIDAARARPLQKVVLMTAMGANADPNAPLRKAELHLEQSGLPYNIIRPTWFMQNFNTYWLQGILEQSKILLPAGTAKGAFIDARDIAAVAAALLARDEFNGRDFDLTGGALLNHDDVAAILSRETGRAIAYEEITPDAMRSRLLAAGLPRDYAEFMLVILGYFKAGYAAQTTDAVPTILGRAPITFEQYAKDHRRAWLA